MAFRVDRFSEESAPGSFASLNTMESIFSDVPSRIDLREALECAGVDADYVMEQASCAVDRAKRNGVLKKLNLSEKDAMVIAAYTAEGYPQMYRVLNRILRETRDRTSLNRIKKLLILFLRILRKLPLAEKSRVYRGIPVKLGPSYKNDSIVPWGAFTSTTWDKGASKFFAQKSGIIFEIEGPCKGYDLSELSVYTGESELLLEPETRIKITAVEKGSTPIVKCRIVYSEFVLKRLVLFNFVPDLKTETDISLLKKIGAGENLKTFCELLGSNAIPTKLLHVDCEEIEMNEENTYLRFRRENKNRGKKNNELIQTDEKIGDLGARMVSYSLKTNTTLTILTLAGADFKNIFE